MTDTEPFLKQILKLERMIIESSTNEDFPHKVHNILTSIGPFGFKGFDTINSCMHLARSVPQYYGPKGFGKFNLTLVNNGTFFITVMFMDQMGTEIHDHPFWGCFVPLLGRPYEVEFRYSQQHVIDSQIDYGELISVSGKHLDQNEPRMIGEDSIHLLSRPTGGQFSLLVGQLLADKRANHFFYHPGLRIKNRTDYSYILRLLTLFESTSMGPSGLVPLLEKLELDEVFRMLQFSRYSGNKEVQGEVENFIKVRYSSLADYIDSHDSYMARLKTKLFL